MHHRFTVRQTSAENGDESTKDGGGKLINENLDNVIQTCLVMKLNFQRRKTNCKTVERDYEVSNQRRNDFLWPVLADLIVANELEKGKQTLA
jgi:hypothetical protein